ncbi:MAG TPA: hypothetical protein VMZ29_08605 [Candidatus Bathyarchaeia archaeon]|nr:hypothetical protein [Candidatus Bathyarchaeia archaeon]
MKAKLVKEYMGAGFSFGGGSSIFPVNRGGQMNRGGFGGASNLGGPNMMYTYEIKPLNRTLQPEASDFEEIEETIHDGHFIEGAELNKKDGKLHRGSVLRTVKSGDGSINYYVIICDETSQKMKIDPTTAVLLSGETFVDPRNIEPGKDEADLERAGQMQETMKAKFVNESMTKPVQSTVDEFLTWYTATPGWYDDWQTTNTMEVNGVHAQYDGSDGMTHLSKLSAAKDSPITIEQSRFRPGDWDLSFELDGDEYSLQSGVQAFSDVDDF